MSNLKVSSKGLRFHAPLTDKYLQTAVLASDVSAYHNHAITDLGSATYSSTGYELDGSTDGLEFPGIGIFNTANITIAVRFTPDFAVDSGAYRGAIYDATIADGRYLLVKQNNANSDVLQIQLGGTQIENIASATYAPFWLQNQENTIIISGTSGNNNAWLNGNHIMASNAVAWSATNPTNFYVGINNVGGTIKFDGEIRDVMVYDRIWTAAERAAFDAGSQGLYAPKKLSTLHKGLRFYAPLTDRYLQTAQFASDLGPNHGHTTAVTGSVSYSSAGVKLTNDDRVDMELNGALDSNNVTIAMRFTPDTAFDANDNREFFATTAGAGARWSMLKLPDSFSNAIGVRIANTLIAQIPTATYSAHWVVGQETTFILSTTESTPSTSVWMNGELMLDADNTAYTKGPNPTQLLVGGISTIDFNGTIRDIRIWDRILTADERAEYEAETLATRQKVSTLQKGLLFDMPLTSEWTQSSTVASDRSAYRNHGTATGTPPTFGADGVTLNGSSDYVINNTADWRSSDSLGSISAWVYSTSTAGPYTILGSANDGGATPYIYMHLYYRKLRFDQSSVNTIQGTTLITHNAWHHVVVTSNGSRWLMYLDGAPESFSVSNGSDNGAWFADTSLRDNLTIGALKRSSIGQYFPGTISGVKTWNRELSAAEILQLYNQGRQ